MIKHILDAANSPQVVVLLGLQWGDEGKGKVSDSITKNLDKQSYIVVGPNGGGNAGHTVVVDKSESTGQRIKLAFHELPGGAVEAEHIFLSQGRIVNLQNLIKESEEIEFHKPNSKRKIYIASRAIVNIIGAYNKVENVIEDAKGANKVGSTLQGIGPAYAGESLRTAITVGQLFSLTKTDIENKIDELCKVFTYLDREEISEKLWSTKEAIYTLMLVGKIMVVPDDFLTTDKAKGKHILIEGAQSVGLGKFGGSYPNNTSSDCSLHGILSACLLPKADICIGVTKAIVSKVGGGRFNTKLETSGVPEDFVSEYREMAGEYGATTKRPRQLGFFDAVQLRHVCKTGNKPDVLWINMGDMLKLFADKNIPNKIATSYKVSRPNLQVGGHIDLVLTDSVPMQEDSIIEIGYENLPAVYDIEKDLADWLQAIRTQIDFHGPVVIGIGPGAEENMFFDAPLN